MAGGLLLICVLTCLGPSRQATAQEGQQESRSSDVILDGSYTEWSVGPDGTSSTTELAAPDGSRLLVCDYIYKAGRDFKARFENCTRDAFRVVEDAKLPGTKKRRAGRRTLALFRDSEGRESAVLCRSEGKRKLTTVWGQTVENVLGFERTSLP